MIKSDAQSKDNVPQMLKLKLNLHRLIPVCCQFLQLQLFERNDILNFIL